MSFAQSSSVVQLVLQVVWSQANGSQGTWMMAGQVPLPSQAAGRASTPPVQFPGRQDTAEPTKPTHAVRSTPSHDPLVQGSCADPVGHAGRLPCGASETG